MLSQRQNCLEFELLANTNDTKETGDNIHTDNMRDFSLNNSCFLVNKCQLIKIHRIYNMIKLY